MKRSSLNIAKSGSGILRELVYLGSLQNNGQLDPAHSRLALGFNVQFADDPLSSSGAHNSARKAISSAQIVKNILGEPWKAPYT